MAADVGSKVPRSVASVSVQPYPLPSIATTLNRIGVGAVAGTAPAAAQGGIGVGVGVGGGVGGGEVIGRSVENISMKSPVENGRR